MEFTKYEKLTNLLYFDYFKEEAQKLIDEGKNNLVLYSLNICNFTYINHKYGYKSGDDVLIQVADYINSNMDVRLSSRAYSDHYFALSEFDGPISGDALSCLDLEQHNAFIHQMKQLYPLASFDITMGIYIIESKEDITSAIDKVEIARRSINTNTQTSHIQLYEEKLMQQELTKISVVPMFRSAIEDGRVIAYYQPKINSHTGEIVGAESLARIEDAEGGILTPYRFVTQLEQVGIISELDLFIIEQVHKDMTVWKEQGKRLTPVSINLSRVDFYDEKFPDKMKVIIDRYDIDKDYIVFEVTETMFFDNVEYMIERVNQIKQLGYKVSLDDFGSGYSSLSMVSKLPVDEIKFDRSFVQNSIDSTKGIKLIRGLINTIKGVDLDIVGEGIENKGEEKIMQECGCDVIQGYVYDRPLQKDRFALKYL